MFRFAAYVSVIAMLQGCSPAGLTEQHLEQLKEMDIGERVIVYVEEKGEYGIVIDDQTAGNNPNLWIYDNSGRGWSAARKGSCAGGTIKLEASGLYFYCGTIPEDSSNDNVEIAGQQANLAILENGLKVWFVVSSQDVEPYVN